MTFYYIDFYIVTSNIFFGFPIITFDKNMKTIEREKKTSSIFIKTDRRTHLANKRMFRLRSVVEYYFLAVFCRFENGFGYSAVTALLGECLSVCFPFFLCVCIITS